MAHGNLGGMDLYSIARSGLFRLDPEQAHNLTLKLASFAPALAAPWARALDPRLRVNVAGQSWRTPIGLAAGLDKNAVALDFFARLGLGSMECGTVTPLPQIGNPRPRLFRYAREASLRNSMGFPNGGSELLLKQLAARPPQLPLGINIGKSKAATPAEAIDEYALLYEKLAPQGDWMVVNISSPNTPGLRDLQQESWLKDLFGALAPLRARLGRKIFVKLAPDMEDQQLQDLTSTLADLGADGLVATNTTHIPERGLGGVSGRLLRVKGHQKRRAVLRVALDRKLPLVGVGGIENMSDVYALWASGGGAFQVYTAFIFQGPQLIVQLERETLAFLDRAGLTNLEQFLTQSPSERQKLIGSFGTT